MFFSGSNTSQFRILSIMSRKIQEGDEHMKNASKFMTKSMFKWSVDYLSAAPLLEKAATAYRAGGDINKAIDALEKAADAHSKNGGSFKAAQQMETAAKLRLEQYKSKNPAKGAAYAKKFYQRAAGFYTDRGELGKAGDALRKCATMLEGIDDSSACDLYFEACDLMETQDKPHYAIECFRKALGFTVKVKKYQEALALIQRIIPICTALNQPSNVHKYCLSITILQLAIGDVVAADRTFTEHLQDDSYLHSDECKLAEDLIIPFKNGNDEALQETLKNQGYNYLDNQIARLAKKLSVYGNESMPKRTVAAKPVKKSTQNTAPKQKAQQHNTAPPVTKKVESKKKPATDLDAALDALDFAEDDFELGEDGSPSESLDDALDSLDMGEGNDADVDLR